MPDIDPAALSRPTVTLTTPVLSGKSLPLNSLGTTKTAKSSQVIPSRVDLEPLYSALKSAITKEQWVIYKNATTQFIIGQLSQTEHAERIAAVLGPDKEYLHNQLIAAIFSNVTREMPDQGLAPWVSANDKKPIAPVPSKPVSGDAAERRLKGDVMQLPAKDRRRIKDLLQNEVDPHESISNVFADPYRRPSSVPETIPSSAAGGINKMNLDVEIRKRFAQPLAVESGEFPDVGLISGRMLPISYEAGLTSGHVAEAPQLMSVATEIFIKEVLTQIFSRTRSNGPGDSGSAGFGIGTTWIRTWKYQRQLGREEEAALRGEVTRDKIGLLPVEAKAASERRPLGMADMRLALELSDMGMAQFPVLSTQVLHEYREGELENCNDYTWVNREAPEIQELPEGCKNAWLPNGYGDAMDIDSEAYWEGTDVQDVDMLDGMLDSCLAVRS